MFLRTKLLLYFFSISILIVIVGMVFYFQLKNLIEPLTPESIPRSVEHLSSVIDRNDMVHNLKYQQLLVEYNLENYLFTKKLISLQDYYKNSAIVQQMLNQANTINPALFAQLEKKYNEVTLAQTQLIQMTQSHPDQALNQHVNDLNYQALLQDFDSELTHYFYQPENNSNEDAVITVKLAAKNSHVILQKSLNTTLIIFVDAVLASLLLVFLSTRAIVQPINILRTNIEQMSVEKLSVRINPWLLHLKSEVGDLARAFAELFHRLRVSTVLRDELLTEIKRHKITEIQLEETAMRLRESNQDLDQFAYAASHDLRSPLKAIENLSTWIEEDCYHLLPEKSRQHFDLIKKRITRLDALIAGMLEYSRAGRVSQDLETIDLNRLIPEIIDNLSPPSHIKVHIKSTLPTLITEKAKITQVFLNLISNAIKYNDKQQGYINIGHEVIDHFYQFYIEDNGCGIDSQFYEKIFEIFQTLHSRDTIESSGIGLAIVKKIVEKKGGMIWLQSKIHQGTTFFFTWPMK